MVSSYCIDTHNYNAEVAVCNVCNFARKRPQSFCCSAIGERTAGSYNGGTRIMLLQNIRHSSLWLSFCWLEVVHRLVSSLVAEVALSNQ